MSAEEEPIFPTVKGKALTGEEFRVPDNLTAKYNLVLLAFLREQQKSIDTWIPRLEELERTDLDFAFYEFPVLPEMNAIARWWIYQGMRGGIRSREARARTITFHLDKNEFRTHLQIQGEGTILLFLLDRRGTIFWRSSGEWSRNKEDSLRQALIKERGNGQAPGDSPISGKDR